MYFRNTKVYFQGTKVYSGSTKVYSPSTKVHFQSTSILSTFKLHKYTFKEQKFPLEVQKYTVEKKPKNKVVESAIWFNWFTCTVWGLCWYHLFLYVVSCLFCDSRLHTFVRIKSSETNRTYHVQLGCNTLCLTKGWWGPSKWGCD